MGIVEFFEAAMALKDVKRQGWVERGVKLPESAADHSMMMALLCLILPSVPDRERAVKMALVHDLPEAVTGDRITKENWPEGGSITCEAKVKEERAALIKILDGLDDEARNGILGLWSEFEEGRTPVAVFVKQLDTAERIIQASRYNRNGNFVKPLKPFWDDRNMSLLKDKAIKALVENIIRMGR